MIFRDVLALVRELRAVQGKVVADEGLVGADGNPVGGSGEGRGPLHESGDEVGEIEGAHHVASGDGDEGGGGESAGVVLGVRVGHHGVAAGSNDHDGCAVVRDAVEIAGMPGAQESGDLDVAGGMVLDAPGEADGELLLDGALALLRE